MTDIKAATALKGFHAIYQGLKDDFEDGKLTLDELRNRLFQISKEILMPLGIWNRVIFQVGPKNIFIGTLVHVGNDFAKSVLRWTGLHDTVILDLDAIEDALNFGEEEE
jgi:hypothetical protein